MIQGTAILSDIANLLVISTITLSKAKSGLALSPQCGFGGIDSKAMSEDDMWRKFDRLVEVAVQVWG
jgi:hypothetical protein